MFVFDVKSAANIRVPNTSWNAPTAGSALACVVAAIGSGLRGIRSTARCLWTYALWLLCVLQVASLNTMEFPPTPGKINWKRKHRSDTLRLRVCCPEMSRRVHDD